MEQPKDVKIQLPQDVAEGIYSNLVVISHAATEMVFDFAQMLPGTPEAIIRDRIIMDPVHAKRLLSALQDNIAKYERTYGPIVEPTMKANGGNNNTPATPSGNVPFNIDPMGDA